MGFNANIIKMDKFGNVKDYTFILSTKNYNHLGQLNNVKRDTIHCVGNLASANELSFEVYKTVDGKIEKCWSEIANGKSIYVPELDEYYQATVTYDDKLDEVKTVTCTSLCESELGQINIDGTEINTETDIERPDYTQTTFYNPDNPKASLLHRVLSYAPHYKIGYVDASLWNIQRSFSIDGTPIYDFLTGECAEQFNCLFAFDSTTRTINVYDLYSTCKSCGYRGAYHNECPECGNTDISYFGEDTTIFVNKENLTDDIKLEIGETKNCFKLVAGDDEMTTTVRSLNPNGSAYLIHISDDMKKDMTDTLVQKLKSYDELYNEYIDEYQQIVSDYNDVIAEIGYYTHTMMPAPEDEDTDDETISIAEGEALKLSASKLSPLGLSEITTSTTKETADSAVINYARVFVNTGLVRIEVNDSTFTYKGKDKYDWDYGTWTGTLKLTAYSDAEDIAYTNKMTLTIHDNYGDYIKQKAMKDVSLVDEEGSIYDVLSIDNLTQFKSALTLYCESRLTSFRTAIETAMTSLMSLDQASEGADWYDDVYVPYYNKLKACEAEIDKRGATIATLEKQAETLNAQKTAIQKKLNFRTYLGEDLYFEFCSYRREQEYNNSNYISDALPESEKIERARDFLDAAKKELIKASSGQHNITTTLYNLMLMEEFMPIVDKFALGNFIRIKVGSDIYRLRLIGYDINFSDLSKINVTFSDATKLNDTMDDINSILNSAQSMGSTYSYVQNQANKGEKANTTINEMIQNSLDAATMKIKNNVNEEVTTDNNGTLYRSFDDITGTYSPKQLRLTHNLMLYTKNNWLSSELGIGEMTYTLDGKTYEDYGVITHYLIAGKVIAGDIYSANYSSSGKGCHFDLDDGSFTFADGKLSYDNSTNKLTLKDVNIEWSNSTAPKISDINELSDNLETMSANITANANAITAEVKRSKGAEEQLSSKIEQTAESITSTVSATYETKSNASSNYKSLQSSITQTANSIESKVSKTDYNGKELVSLINQTAEAVTIDANKINLNGAVTANKYFKILNDGSMESTSGKIGGIVITSDRLYSQNSMTKGTSDVQYEASIRKYNPNANNPLTEPAFLLRKRNYDGTNYGSWTHMFKVTYEGKLTAKDADIEGKITATSGSIGGCSISNGVLKIKNINIGEKLTADSIDATDLHVSSANIDGTITATKVSAATGSINNVTATNLTVTSGTITLGDATLSASGGLVISGTKNIGGSYSKLGCVNVDSNSLFIGTWDYSSSTVANRSTPSVFMCSGSKYEYPLAGVQKSGWVFGAGKNFGVTLDGSLYCSKGQIGNWTISDGALIGKSVNNSGTMRLYPSGIEYTATDSKTYTFYVVIYNSGGSVPLGGLTSSGWKEI